MKNNYLECGKILAPHGVRGAFKVEHWCDNGKVLTTQKTVYLLLGDNFAAYNVISAHVSTDTVIMSVEGITTREQAQALKNRTLYLERSSIPLREGQYFLSDMIGLPVVDAESGRVYGNIEDITDGVRYRLYHVRTESGLVVYPALSQFVKEVSLDKGLIITPIEGFFEK